MKASKTTQRDKKPVMSGNLSVEEVVAEQAGWFDEQLGEHHYLGAGRPVGDYLRQVVRRRGVVVALLVWGPACYALKDRDLWIGWSANQRVERLKLVVQNRRFLLLTAKGGDPNLASQALAAALRALPGQWVERFGYAPVLAETFTDPESYAGTCYKASNWQAVGSSAGYSRHRADFYVPNDRPKRLWLYELDEQARTHLRALRLSAAHAAAAASLPSGTLPLRTAQMDSLHEVLRSAPDPRSKNIHFSIGAVLCIVSMALLAGRREIAEIARFATTLSQSQRTKLGLPLKKGTKAFRQVPGYSVFYQILCRMDPEPFAALLTNWLQQQAGSLPIALALDGKMIRDHIGLLTLAEHEDGTPQAVALYDQKHGTQSCELTSATAMLKTLGTLDEKLVTADALHCQRENASVIVQKGGDYLLQIKANQPNLLKQAQAAQAAHSSPFLPSHIAPAVASKNAHCSSPLSSPPPPTSPSPAL